jgi:hypothetical protein
MLHTKDNGLIFNKMSRFQYTKEGPVDFPERPLEKRQETK